MNLGLSYLAQIRDGFTRQTLTQLITNISAGYGKQHNADDTHGTITATGTIAERKRTTPMGAWTAIAFAAVSYTATGTTWTVTSAQQLVVKYMLIGTTLFVTFSISGTTVGAATANLFLTLSSLNAVPAATVYGTCAYNDNGTKGIGVVKCATGTTSPQLTLMKDIAASVNWSNSAAMTIAGTIAFDVSGSI